MAEFTLVAEPGRAIGSAASRRLRAAGRVPAVVYGHGADAKSVSVDARDLRHALSGDAGLNQLLSLKIGSETHLALARALQRHPVRHTVVHVDFQIVRRDEVISAEVPLILVGEAKAVEQERGLVEQLLNSLTVKATPDKIPGNLEIDISALTIGEAIRVGDLKLPAGVATELSPDDVIAMGAVTRAAVEEEVAEAEAAEAEGEAAGQAAGGGAPAGGAEAGGEGASQPEEG
ncbi:MAG TPA: 50S ribosomal protein L25 [Acidimicrobiales bacterium]|nr:50S ribosomal protein L25 [Acidimicrobiales bacterium]